MDDHLKQLLASGPMRATYHHDTGTIHLIDRQGLGHTLSWWASVQYMVCKQMENLISQCPHLPGSLDEQKAKCSLMLLVAVEKLLDAGVAQLKYNVETNVPNHFMGVGEVAHHATQRGFTSAISNYINFDPTKAADVAADICEDVNYHDLAKLIRDYSGGMRYRPIHKARKTKRGFQPKASKKKD